MSPHRANNSSMASLPVRSHEDYCPPHKSVGLLARGKGFVPVPPATAAVEVVSVQTTLTRRDVVVTLVARTGERASEPRSICLTYAGPRREQRKQPRLLALLFGVS